MKIEKNIPIPERKHGIVRYPFIDMGIGESFLAPIEKENSVKVAAAQFGKRHDMLFLARIVHGGIRVWRVE